MFPQIEGRRFQADNLLVSIYIAIIFSHIIKGDEFHFGNPINFLSYKTADSMA